MTKVLLGKKIGMTQVFDGNGNAIPVTAVQAGPCTVLQVKTSESDRYESMQIGFEDKKPSRVSKPEGGHAKRWNTTAKRFVREAPLPEEGEVNPGDQLSVDIFEGIGAVDIQGISKGRGFAGVMKRWNFSGLRASHGVKRRHRAPGSIGCSQDPGRVLKGKKMAGHYGNEKVTARNLKIIRIDKENNLLLVKGSVPGANGGYLFIRSSKY